MWTAGLQKESSPPFYYMAVGAWADLFGTSEIGLRSLSAVSSTIAIVLVYILARELAGRVQALVAAGLFAVSATQIYYAQEARPYALLLIPCAVMLIACARYLRPSCSAVRTSILYAAAAVVSIYIHATMVFLVAACSVVIAAYIAKDGREKLAVWGAANLCVGIFTIPELVGMVGHVEAGILSWIPPVSFHNVAAVASNTLAGTLTPGHFPGGIAAALLSAALAVALWRYKPNSATVAVTLAIPGVFAAIVVLVSLFVQPILLSRIFAWVGVPLCIVEACALGVRGWLRYVALIPVAGVTGIALFYQLDASPQTNEPWRQVIHSLRAELTAANLVVLGPDTDPGSLMYYAPEMSDTSSKVVMWTTLAALGVLPILFHTGTVSDGEIVERIAAGERIVFLARATDKEAVKALLEHVSPPLRRIETRCIGGDGKPTTFPCGVSAWVWGDYRSAVSAAW